MVEFKLLAACLVQLKVLESEAAEWLRWLALLESALWSGLATIAFWIGVRKWYGVRTMTDRGWMR